MRVQSRDIRQVKMTAAPHMGPPRAFPVRQLVHFLGSSSRRIHGA